MENTTNEGNDRIEKSALNSTVTNIEIDLRMRMATAFQETVHNTTNRDIEISHLNTRLGNQELEIQSINGDVANLEGAVRNTSTEIKTSESKTDVVLLKFAEGLAFVIKDEINDVRAFVSSPGFGHHNFTAAPASSSNNCRSYVPLTVYQAKVLDLDSRMNAMQDQINLLISKSDEASIKSFGLGFRDSMSSEAWLVANMDDASFGLFVDVHLVFENLFHMIEKNESTLKTLHSIAKLNLANMTEALCLMSFDARVPKILSESSNLAFPTKTSKRVSHFDKVDSHIDWANQHYGTKALITNALNGFEISHQIQINTHWPDETNRGRILATKALSTAGSWIREFISYIDATYNSFHLHSSFSAERSWELTTQLGRRILIDMAAPREGVSTAIKIGQGNSRCNNIVFWPMLRAHDVGKAFKDAKFGDDPSIAGEYVKFLVSSSGSDSSLREELAVAFKLATKANDASVRALNLLDEHHKKKFAELDKKPKGEQGSRK